MTNEHVLTVCRSNWEYRGVDEASMREMLQELSAHLDDAEAAGRTPEDVVGKDIKGFAASWARARRPLPYRLLRMAAMLPYVLAWLLLLGYAIRRTVDLPIEPSRIALCAVIVTVTVAWELRRGTMSLGKSWLISLVVGLPVAVLTHWLVGDEPLFTMPLWGALLMLLPGLSFLVADSRAKKRAAGAAGDALR